MNDPGSTARGLSWAGRLVVFALAIALPLVPGRVAYAILSFGGLLGVGENYYPVPWKLLTYDAEQRGYVIPLDKDELENAPSFEPDELSGWDDAESRAGIFAYYGAYGVAPF